MKSCLVFVAVLLCFNSTHAAVRQWTNTLGGNWFIPSNWSPNGVPTAIDTANINVAGAYTVSALTGTVAVASLNLGAASGTQTLLIGAPNGLVATNNGIVSANGILNITNGGMRGRFTIENSGQLKLEGAANKNFYDLRLLNRGTILWSGGNLLAGNSGSTTISNGGLWQITGDNQIYQTYGGPLMTLTNSGTIQKTGGSGISQISNFQLVNRPPGIVQATSGTLRIQGGGSNEIGGQFIATSPGLVTITSGTWFDSGGTASGTGTNRFDGGTLNLRTNIIPNLRHTGGDIYVIANTFQQGGAITNLTIDGAQLRGTNRVGNGTLLIRSGGVNGRLTIQPAGTLQFATAPNKNVYNLHLINQGTVDWSAGNLLGGNTASTTISNGGLWLVSGDNQIYQTYGGPTITWTNTGILRKTAGAGISQISNFMFVNRPGATVEALSGTLQFNGTDSPASQLGGQFLATAPAVVNLAGGTWTDAGGTAGGTGITRFNGTILNLRTNIIPNLLHTGGDIYVIANTFQQSGAITNLALDGSQLRGTNRIGTGILTLRSGGTDGQLTVEPGGTLRFTNDSNKNVYNLVLLNRGTVEWFGGNLLGGNTSSTTISNGGLWQITGDSQIYQTYGGPTPNWLNTGTLRKSGGTGISHISSFNFVNAPGGIVQALSGTLQLSGGTNNLIGGTFSATTPGLINIASGTWFDSGGTATGTGISRFNGGTLNLRTNIIPNLLHTGGDVYVIANTFQQTGSITNLTIDGSQLRGTNRIGTGTLVINSGGSDGVLIVGPTGKLQYNTAANKNIYNLRLINQGTVVWSDGNLLGGNTLSTTISNGGLWQITGNNQAYQTYGGAAITWTNTGTILKSGGTGLSYIADFRLMNASSGVIQCDVGTLQLPGNFTNTAGTLKLNGGTIQNSGPLYVSGGILEGQGTVGQNGISGGSISPGQSGPGLIGFKSGLTLSTGAIVSIGGTGTTPITQYDQLSITGAVTLANATLQVTSLPSVPPGTTFLILQNDGVDPISGTFNGLPQNAALNVSGQQFRIHYNGGTGNDVTLVRDSGTGAGGPQLATGGYSNGVFRVRGAGGSSVIYVIQATTNFLQWTNIGTATGDISGNFFLQDTNAFRFPYRFYRTTN
mgnify:CR=1 FL=1